MIPYIPAIVARAEDVVVVGVVGVLCEVAVELVNVADLVTVAPALENALASCDPPVDATPEAPAVVAFVELAVCRRGRTGRTNARRLEQLQGPDRGRRCVAQGGDCR